MDCPECGSENIFRSHRRPLERLVGFIPHRPMRCADCQSRFWMWIRSGRPVENPVNGINAKADVHEVMLDLKFPPHSKGRPE